MPSRRGMFGTISVQDVGACRELCINGQRQGACFLEPPASVINSELPSDAPGPVCASPYAVGWLLAGVHKSNATGLMVGLGSGGGAVQLLANFPWIDLTVIEIDPVMVQCALDSFPLLEHYMDQAQLNIVVKDAREFLCERYDKWDFGCADAYDGDPCLKDDYLPLLIDRCDSAYVNCIDEFGGESMSRVVSAMRACDSPATEIFRTPGLGYQRCSYTSASNWIITNQELAWHDIVDFDPFPDLEGIRVNSVRELYDDMLVNAYSQQGF